MTPKRRRMKWRPRWGSSMHPRSIWRALSLLAVLCAPLSSTPASEPFRVPRLSGPVVDEGGFLSPAARRQLTSALLEVKRQGGGTEIAVLTVSDLGGLTIEQAAIQVAEQWKLGSAEKDNGVLLLFAKAERRARIEVGQGLEGSLTDAHAKRIIDETIVPLFRSGNIDEGILLGVYQVAQRTNPELNLQQIFGQQRASWSKKPRRGLGLGVLMPLIILLLVLFLGRGRGGLAGGLATGLLLGSLGGRRSGGGGGSSGGGFGGGGGFSGGGASGGW